MQHVFWLRAGQLAGRSGPNLAPWKLEHIKAHGFSAILSVNDGDMVHESLLDQLGLNYARIPMSGNVPIRPGDKDQCLRNLPRAIAFIEKNIEAGPVLIHCRSGKDRTGMVLAASLIAREGLNPSEAMAEVLKVRDIAFSAESWMDFGLDVLTSFYETIR